VAAVRQSLMPAAVPAKKLKMMMTVAHYHFSKNLVAIKTLVVVIVLAIVNLVPKNHAVMKESTVPLQQVIKGHAVMTMAAAVSP